MKIAIIGNEYEQQFPLIGYGGIESCVENLALGLSKTAQQFCCIVPKRVENEPKKNLYPFEIIEADFIPSKKSRRTVWDFMAKVKPILESYRPDIIWSQNAWSVDVPISLGIPVLTTMHDSHEREASWLNNSPLVYYRYISKFQFKNWVTEAWQLPKSTQIYTGLDESEYDFSEVTGTYFLWVAGLGWGWENKGLHLFAKLAKRNPHLHFIAYGSRRFSVEFKLFCATWNLKNFEFRGILRRGEMHREVFKNARAFIFPTQIPETLGRTVLESFSKGTPVLGSANGALPELIQDCGVSTNSFDDLEQSLYMTFNRKKCFENSLRFSVTEEVRRMVMTSQLILSGNRISSLNDDNE
ncbi:MAG: glycosyltransferase family 4 protein [Chloroherpetonaceae bacterium]|nr:glycosyltransferase family 4 protein [Chloroherpetonaceae bacterium]